MLPNTLPEEAQQWCGLPRRYTSTLVLFSATARSSFYAGTPFACPEPSSHAGQRPAARALGIGGRVAPTSTRREPSAFELPSSSAPPAFQAPQERLYIVNPGLSRLQNGHQDTYEPGTYGERGYMRGLSSIWQTDSMVDTATATAELIERDVIEVDNDTIEVETN
jgi:hypothetical protein